MAGVGFAMLLVNAVSLHLGGILMSEERILDTHDILSDKDYEMDLSHSDIKKLWALSGDECAICKCKLVQKKDSDANVGQECHISSERPDWPSKEFTRYEPWLTEDERNKSMYNAIVLCANCHIIIDNPKSTQFTIEELHQTHLRQIQTNIHIGRAPYV